MTITIGVLILTVGFLLLYTATAHQIKQRGISPTVMDLAYQYNSVAVFLGIVFGHWLYPGDHRVSHRVGAVLPVLGAVMVLDAAWIHYTIGRRTWWRYPGLWATVGILAGSFLWGQA